MSSTSSRPRLVTTVLRRAITVVKRSPASLARASRTGMRPSPISSASCCSLTTDPGGIRRSRIRSSSQA